MLTATNGSNPKFDPAHGLDYSSYFALVARLTMPNGQVDPRFVQLRDDMREAVINQMVADAPSEAVTA